MNYLEQVVRLFERRKVTETGCWEWIGPLTKGGYGKTTFANRTIGVHRVAAHIWLDMPLDSKLMVCHECDNRRCFKPRHLFLGTATDNNQDKMRKGRQVSGERVQTAKLTAEIVRVIRERAKAGVTQPVLAAEYGVTVSNISIIVRGLSWKHTQGEAHGQVERVEA